MKIIIDRLAFTLFIISIVILAFGYGIAVHKFTLFPYSLIESIYQDVRALTQRPHKLRPIRYDRVGIEVSDRDKVFPGVTLLTGYWPDMDWEVGVRIIDLDGNKLHHWAVNPADIWPESPHNDSMAGTKSSTHCENSSESYPANHMEYPTLFETSAIYSVSKSVPC